MYKKLCSIILSLLAVMLVFFVPVKVMADDEIKIMVNNKLIKSEVDPFIDSGGRTMVPLRFVSEALGCKVAWYGDLRMAVIDTPSNDTLIFEVDSNKYYINYGKANIMDTKAVIVSGRTYVPLRLVAEILEFDIAWDKTTKTIGLTK